MRWVWYSPDTVNELAGIVATLAANGRDTYVSWAVYSDKQRNKAYALPGPSIFVDDAPEGDYSFKVLTGARRPHGWYILDTPADTATREDLAQRIAYTGGDKSGWDITQLVRPPDTINTKQAYGGHYPVGIGLGTNQRYSVDELAAQFPLVPATQAAGAIDIDDQELKHWLGNVDACIRRIRLGTLTHQILTGTGGNNRSNTRWAMAGYLRKLWGLPSVEIAAILLTFCDWGHSQEKGSNWLRADVRRCIADAEEKYPHATINPTRGTQARPAVTLPEVARQPRGRRRTYAADEYLAWLCEHADAGHVMLTQLQIVAAYGASIATIGRLERELRKQGEIRRPRTANKQGSWLELLRPITNTGAPQNAAVDAAENEPKTAPDVLSQTPRVKDARTREEEHTAPSVPPDAQPQAAAFPAALGAAVGEAFDAYSGARRLSWRKIAEYIAANYPGAPWDDGAIRWWCIRVRKERNRAAWIAGLPSMTQKQLTKLDRWCERLLEEGPDGPRGRQYYAAKWQAPYVAQELASDRRRAALERVKPRSHGRRIDAKQAKVSAPDPVQTLSFLVAGDVQTLTLLDAAPVQELTNDAMEPSWKHGTLMVGPADDDTLITPWKQDHPMDGAKVEHIEVKRPMAGAPLAAVCSSLSAGPEVPELMTPAAGIRPYIPAGGWTAATIAALPGVRSGSMAADDLWIAHNRALAERAAYV